MKAQGVDARDQSSALPAEPSTAELQTETIRAFRSWGFRALTHDLVGRGREYAATFITEFAVMASQIAAYKLAAHFLGKDGFSEYALARRTVTLIVPIPLLGLAVGLPRYIGFSNGQGDDEGAFRYYGATLQCVGVATLLLVVLMNVFSQTFAFLFFGELTYKRLVLPLSLMILGLSLHTVVCCYFRGHIAMNRANLLQFINLAVVPVVAFFLFRHSVSKTLSAIGLIWSLAAGAALFLTPFRAIVLSNWKESKQLLRYGIQRVPGDFILMALFTLPATLEAHRRGIQEAGFVAFGISVVSMVGAAFAPFGLVLLPKATFLLAEGGQNELRQHLRSILRATFGASVALVLSIWIYMPTLIHLYLGASFEQVTPIARLLILGAVPYSVYLVLRNVVDAYHDYGITAMILACGLATFLGFSYFARHDASNTEMILLGFLAAMVLITALVCLECWRILRTIDSDRQVRLS